MTDLSPGELAERIRSYLAMGGLFNPELALHDRVSELIQDCGKLIAQQGQDLARVTAERDALREADRCWTVAEKEPPIGVQVLVWQATWKTAYIGPDRDWYFEDSCMASYADDIWREMPKPPAR